VDHAASRPARPLCRGVQLPGFPVIVDPPLPVVRAMTKRSSVLAVGLSLVSTSLSGQLDLIWLEQGPHDRSADTSHLRYWTADLPTSDGSIRVHFEVHGTESGGGTRRFSNRIITLAGPGVQPRTRPEEVPPFRTLAAVDFVIGEQRGEMIGDAAPERFSGELLPNDAVCATTSVGLRIGSREISLSPEAVAVLALLDEAIGIAGRCPEASYGFTIRRAPGNEPLTTWRPGDGQRCEFDRRTAARPLHELFRGLNLSFQLRQLPPGAGGLVEVVWDSLGAPSAKAVAAPASPRVPHPAVVHAVRETAVWQRYRADRPQSQPWPAILLLLETGPDAQVLIGASFWCRPVLTNLAELQEALAASVPRRGTVVVRMRIDATGVVTARDVLRSSNDFVLDAAALHATYVARWLPGVVRGQPVAFWVALPLAIL
jgi:TonB family protein